VCAELHEISQPALSKIIKKVSKAIAQLSKKYITFPTLTEATAERQKFYRIANFPGIFLVKFGLSLLKFFTVDAKQELVVNFIIKNNDLVFRSSWSNRWSTCKN